MDKKFIDDLAKKLHDAVPEELHQLKNDMEKNFHAILQGTFNRMDLVTRDEYDTQVKVLARTRAKVEELEAKVEALEKELKKNK